MPSATCKCGREINRQYQNLADNAHLANPATARVSQNSYTVIIRRNSYSAKPIPTEGLAYRTSCFVCVWRMAATRVSGLSLRGLNLICRDAAQISNKS